MISNCEYYYNLGKESEYGCLKCKHGYHGEIVSNQDGFDFIKDCKIFDYCDEKEIISGLNPKFKKIVSCHKCL